MIVAALVGILIFGAAALFGVLIAESICARITRFADGPPPAAPRPLLIVAICALVGAVMTAHQNAPSVVAVGALAAFALAGCWYCDLARGIVPDFFTLFPLGILLVFALAQGDMRVLVSALVPFVPFAGAALISRGRGMGWGDAKLVALGGALLGVQSSLLAFAAACIVAVVLAQVRGRRGQPLAFAPYLVMAIASALAFGVYS